MDNAYFYGLFYKKSFLKKGNVTLGRKFEKLGPVGGEIIENWRWSLVNLSRKLKTFKKLNLFKSFYKQKSNKFIFWNWF